MKFRRARAFEPVLTSDVVNLLAHNSACICRLFVSDEQWSKAAQSPNLLVMQYTAYRDQLFRGLRDKGINKPKDHRYPFLVFSSSVSNIYVMIFETEGSMKTALKECDVMEVMEG